jgi:predicted nucleotidyltransferase
MLVEFEEGHVPGFLGLAEMELELSAMLGRKVDLQTLAELIRYFRDEVISSPLCSMSDPDRIRLR